MLSFNYTFHNFYVLELKGIKGYCYILLLLLLLLLLYCQGYCGVLLWRLFYIVAKKDYA
jgi:hypothetical protein